MSKSQGIDYTYRAGKKVMLKKKPDEFVMRALPDEVKKLGVADAEQTSSTSSRVKVRASDLEPMMDRARQLATTHHAYTVADTGQEFLITDRIFVTFRGAPASTEVDAFAAKYGLVLKQKYGDRDYLFQLTDHTGMNPVKLVVKLTEDEPSIESAEHDLNRRARTFQFALPTDPSFERQWHLHRRLAVPAFDTRSSCRAEDAWRLLDGFGSPDVVIGVTDDGCKLDHPDFNGPEKFAGWGYMRGERLVNHADIDADPDEMYKFGSNHGTSCAGVIAAEVDAVLTVGVAPGCRLLPIQWESSGPSLFISDSKLLTVLDFLADKVDVISNSWGSTPTSTWIPLVVNRIRQLAQTGGRRGQGIVFLWAAGNENCPINHIADIDVPYTWGWEQRADGSWFWVGVETTRRFENNLVDIPGLMHVAALASNAQRSHYSNYGPGIEICAPTNNVHQYQRMMVTGLGITTATGSTGGLTERFGGTSSATPVVAGVVGLVLSANPSLSAIEVNSILKQTAAKDLSLQGYPRTPPATFDPNPTWDVSPIAPFDQGDFTDIGSADGTWSPWFGHGRVDAEGAVAEALRRRPTDPLGAGVRKSSSPAIEIPDNRSDGIRDIINVPEAFTIQSLKVGVAISHTYIGDLKLTLIAPSGDAVVLHDRNGGNTDNLNRTYDLATTPALAALAGQSTQGNWTLWVQDLARVDAGTLNRWELEISTGAFSPFDVNETPGAMIPDNNPVGVERTLDVPQAGEIRDIEVALDITHTHIGDLKVTLFPPAGPSVVLHDRSGGAQDNLVTTYKSASMSALAGLRGQPMQGVWRLKVADLEAADVGKLNRWAIKIVG
jgi:subtilisin-like proprotein convertase family protein/subtilisin family serine protease